MLCKFCKVKCEKWQDSKTLIEKHIHFRCKYNYCYAFGFHTFSSKKYDIVVNLNNKNKCSFVEVYRKSDDSCFHFELPNIDFNDLFYDLDKFDDKIESYIMYI